MKECKECEYFGGYNYDDGTPICSYQEGFENCPYCGETDVKKEGVSIRIDSGFMSDFIRHTLMNTIENEAKEIAKQEIKNLITDKIRETIKTTMEESVKTVIDEELENFMNGTITVGGGWLEPGREITRREFMAETVEKQMQKNFNVESVRKEAENQVRNAIEKWTKNLRDSINGQIKQIFSDTTRAALTDSVVNMLMCNDTYKKLSDSMNSFLPSGK